MSDAQWRDGAGWGTTHATMPNGDEITVYPCGIGRPHTWYYSIHGRYGGDVRHSRRCASQSQAQAAAIGWWRKHREADHAD